MAENKRKEDGEEDERPAHFIRAHSREGPSYASITKQEDMKERLHEQRMARG